MTALATNSSYTDPRNATIQRMKDRLFDDKFEVKNDAGVHAGTEITYLVVDTQVSMALSQPFVLGEVDHGICKCVARFSLCGGH